MNWRNNPELVAAVTGSAVRVFFRPANKLLLTILSFLIGVAVASVLSPALNDLIGIEKQSVRSVTSFMIGLLGMLLLPAIMNQAEKRQDRIANKIIGVALNLKEDKEDPEVLQSPSPQSLAKKEDEKQ